MEEDVPGQVARLRDFSRHQLLDLWVKVYGREAPLGMRRELLVPFLAYKIQENAYGGLKSGVRAELLRISQNLKNDNSSTKTIIRRKLKTGTRLIRPWRGDTHEIFVTESSYEYRGVRYRSLSEIARKITGTRWSGPAFFKLNGTRLNEEGHGD
jgi:Protein of unknown function (DUF2924)